MAEISSFDKTSTFTRLTVDRSCRVGPLTRVVDEIRSRNYGVFVRLRRPNERGLNLLVNAMPISVNTREVVNGLCSGVFCGITPTNGVLVRGSLILHAFSPSGYSETCSTRDLGERVSIGRVGGVVSRFVGNTVHTRGTNTSNMRLRTTRNCLVRRFLDPCAGAQGSRCNKDFRGEVGFLVSVVGKVGTTYNGSFPVIIHLSISRYCSVVNGPRVNCGLRSKIEVTGILRGRKVSTVSISYTNCSACGC